MQRTKSELVQHWRGASSIETLDQEFLLKRIKEILLPLKYEASESVATFIFTPKVAMQEDVEFSEEDVI